MKGMMRCFIAQPFLLAVLRGHGEKKLEAARLLLEAGADPNMVIACRESPVGLQHENLGRKCGKTTILDELVKFGSNKFSRKGDADAIKLLLESGADPNKSGPGPSLLDLVMCGSSRESGGTVRNEIAKLLVEHGAKISDHVICSSWWDEPMRKYLLEKSGRSESDFKVTIDGDSRTVECGTARSTRCTSYRRREGGGEVGGG